jgi:hypothetical protein
MAATERRLSKEEFARRGDQIYETRIRPELTAEDERKFVAVDMESGSFEVDVDELEACDKLNSRVPDAQVWLVRVGSRYLHRFGDRETRKTP